MIFSKIGQYWSMNLIDPTLIYLKASFATTAKTYQSLPSEFIFFSSFTMVKPGFCAKISSQISDPQKTTVLCRIDQWRGRILTMGHALLKKAILHHRT